jgi:hypothetical protein
VLPPISSTKVRVPSQESERSCIYVLGVSILPLSKIFQLDVWNCYDSGMYFVLYLVAPVLLLRRYTRTRIFRMQLFNIIQPYILNNIGNMEQWSHRILYLLPSNMSDKSDTRRHRYRRSGSYSL